jgi:hypothetical protein
MGVTALVSAYYAADLLKERLVNLEEEGADTYVICQAGSKEAKIAQRWGVMKALTPDIPTLYAAWNLGIKVTDGDYLTSANCDDLFYSGGLAAMVEYLDTHPDIDIVHGDCDVRDRGHIHAWKREGESVSLMACRVGPMPVWRRSLHKKFGLFDAEMKVAGDYDFWLRCVMGGASVKHIDRVIGVYWKREDSLEHRNADDLRRENAIIRERYK